jgi:hypothetical protein
MAIHIFWDNSNIWGGLQGIRERREPAVPWFALRAYFRNIYQLISKDRESITRVMAGSVPPECEELWEYARNLGFSTDLLRRVESSPDIHTEQAVDEVMHMKMANAVLDYQVPQTMVLLSGDSRISAYGTSFPSQIERALRYGWDAEIYAASMTISRRIYAPILQDFPNKLQIVELDPYYASISFVKGGEYFKKDSTGNRTYFTIPDRIVAPLR